MSQQDNYKVKGCTPSIQLRSEEVQELMGRVPPAILRVGMLLVLVLVLLLVLAASLIEYPDERAFTVVLQNVERMEEVTAPAAGYLEDDISGEERTVKRGSTLLRLTEDRSGQGAAHAVVAPITGTVVPYEVGEAGEFVSAGTPLMAIADTIYGDFVVGRAHVKQDVWNKMHVGQNIKVQLPDTELTGRITKIARQHHLGNGTYAVDMRFRMPTAHHRLIFWKVTATAKLRLNEQTILQKIVKERVNANSAW